MRRRLAKQQGLPLRGRSFPAGDRGSPSLSPTNNTVQAISPSPSSIEDTDYETAGEDEMAEEIDQANSQSEQEKCLVGSTSDDHQDLQNENDLLKLRVKKLKLESQIMEKKLLLAMKDLKSENDALEHQVANLRHEFHVREEELNHQIQSLRKREEKLQSLIKQLTEETESQESMENMDSGVAEQPRTAVQTNPMPNSPEDPIDQVDELMRTSPKTEDSGYLVSMKWFNSFRYYLDSGKNEKVHPGPVDNSSLFKKRGISIRKPKLRERLHPNIDYVLVQEVVWTILIGVFGIQHETHTVANDAGQLVSPPRNLPGVCGLENMGNTCFLNSAIQCLSNIPSLTEYFLSEKYRKDINAYNGMKGQIAKQYGSLIQQMWSGNSHYLKPRGLKETIGRFVPQYSGYGQGDCHELMTFLLEGLHDDLNRTRQGSYPTKTGIGRKPDHIGRRPDIDSEQSWSWSNHRMRNDSIIVDTFHGLLKSTVICSNCFHRSVTFDLFSSLSLPIPSPSPIPITIPIPSPIAVNVVLSRYIYRSILGPVDGQTIISMVKLNGVLIPREGRVSEMSSIIYGHLSDHKIVGIDGLILANSDSQGIPQSLFDSEDPYMWIPRLCPTIYAYETVSRDPGRDGNNVIPVPVYLGEDSFVSLGHLLLSSSHPVDEVLYHQVDSYVRMFFEEELTMNNNPSPFPSPLVKGNEVAIPDNQQEGIQLQTRKTIFTINVFNSKRQLVTEGHYLQLGSFVSVSVSPETRLHVRNPIVINCSKDTDSSSRSPRTRTSVFLTDCFDMFTSDQPLSNERYCSKCKKVTQGTRKRLTSGHFRQY